MKSAVAIIVLLLFQLPVFGQKNGIEITGWTNVNSFKCSNLKIAGTASVYSFTGNQLPNLIFKLDDFDCQNKMMTADLRKILQSDRYPTLHIRFLEFKQSSAGKFDGLVEVKMMTISRRYAVQFTVQDKSLVGNKKLKFSDFKIVPPKKMGGMVYVRDELDLLFSIAIAN